LLSHTVDQKCSHKDYMKVERGRFGGGPVGTRVPISRGRADHKVQ
jgi:hypothetical protein